MAYYFKIGLLVRTEDNTKFLVCEKSPEFDTDEYILPGGLLTESSEEDCLKNEIEEELDCQIDMPSLEYVETYTGPAAGHTDRDITIKLYTGNLIGVPRPCAEIEYLHWIGKDDIDNPRVSHIIREQIIPDLVDRKLLR